MAPYTLGMMTTKAKPTPELIIAATRALASVCNGAQGWDGHGYNKIDTGIMRDLAAQKTPHSPRQLKLMWNILRKYTKQLAGHGFDWSAMVPPEVPSAAEVAANTSKVTLGLFDSQYGQRISVSFPYSAAMVAEVKAMWTGAKSGPWFDGASKLWLFPVDRMVELFKKFEGRYDLTKDLAGAMERVLEKKLEEKAAAPAQAAQKAPQGPAAAVSSLAVDSTLDVPTKLPLRPFQRAGVEFVDAHAGRALVADEMGLGKTVQGLGYLALRPQALPALIVCPSGLRVNWARETSRFTTYKPLVLSAKSGLKGLLKLGVDADLVPRKGFDVTIMNYDLFETETVSTWIRRLAGGDASGVPYLLKAGQYALKGIDKARAKPRGKDEDAGYRAALEQVRKDIVAQGESANRRKFVRVLVNGVSLEEFVALGNWNTLIFDEMHYLKDMKSQRAMGAEQLQKSVKHVIGLTGTPIKNRPIEIWSQTRVIKPDLFPNFMKFAQRYCDAKQTRFGWDFSGASNLDELDRVLRASIMIRREKAQVLKDLPPTSRVTVPLVLKKGLKAYEQEAGPVIAELKKLKEERRAWKEATEKLSDEDRKKYVTQHAVEASRAQGLTGYVLAEIEKAKQAAMDAKFDDSLEFILNAQQQQGKILVFATHIETIEKLVTEISAAGIKVDMIHGGISQARRIQIKDAFQDGDLQVLVCGIRAASEGLTLTASHTVIFVEFDWNPAVHDQAEKRVDRIGQTVASTMYYLVAAGTIEEEIVAMIDSKREVVNASVGEGHRTLSEDGILDALIEKMVA